MTNTVALNLLRELSEITGGRYHLCLECGTSDDDMHADTISWALLGNESPGDESSSQAATQTDPLHPTLTSASARWDMVGFGWADITSLLESRLVSTPIPFSPSLRWSDRFGVLTPCRFQLREASNFKDPQAQAKDASQPSVYEVTLLTLHCRFIPDGKSRFAPTSAADGPLSDKQK
jgi:hypothetical protein